MTAPKADSGRYGEPTMILVLQQKSPNIHQVLEARTENRTFHAWRWKDIAVIECAAREDAEARFASLLSSNDFRLEDRTWPSLS